MFQCTECNFVTGYKKNLVSHTKSRHENPIIKNENTTVAPICVKNEASLFSCPECDYMTPYKCTLLRHAAAKHIQHETILQQIRDQKGQLVENKIPNNVLLNATATVTGNHNSVAVTNNPVTNYIMIFPSTDSATPQMLQCEDQKRRLIEFLKPLNLTSPADITKAIYAFFDNNHGIPIRKMKENSGNTHVYKGDNIWEKKPDSEVYPRLVAKSAEEMSYVLNDASEQTCQDILARRSDQIGNFADSVELFDDNSLEYHDREYKERRHHKNAFMRARMGLKNKAYAAYKEHKFSIE